MKTPFGSTAVTLLAMSGISLHARPVPLNPTWQFFDPEGNSSLDRQSATRFDFTVSDIRGNLPNPNQDPGEPDDDFLGGNAVRPRVYQIFQDLDMTIVGQAVEVSFDLELADQILESNRGDLHLSLFDTSTNYEFIPLFHIGPNPDREGVGDFVKFRIDGFITPGGNTFDPGDITGMGSGGNSRAGQAHHPGKPLAETGCVHNIAMRVERVSDTELSFRLTWTYRNSGPPAENTILGTSTYSFASYDETTGVIDGEADPGTSDAWANSKVSQFNGFGMMLHDDDPFDSDNNDGTIDEGTLVISNFAIDYTTLEHPPFQITGIVIGEDNIIEWEAQPGSTYSVWTSTDLQKWDELDDGVEADTEVGEYVHVAPEAADERFYQVRWSIGG